METNNHYFDAQGLYSGSAPANPGSAAPANALRVPPSEKTGFWPAVNAAGDGWDLREDHRGRRGWVRGEPAVVAEVGPLPDGWSDARPATGNAVGADERRAAEYRVRADPHRDAALSYWAEAEGWRLLGNGESAALAEEKARDRFRLYAEEKRRIRSRVPEDSEPAGVAAGAEDVPTAPGGEERVFLTRTGTYHAAGCAYTTAAGAWLTLEEVMAKNASARPCGRCGPPKLPSA